MNGDSMDIILTYEELIKVLTAYDGPHDREAYDRYPFVRAISFIFLLNQLRSGDPLELFKEE